MSEIEQLRKEIGELRERLARLESRKGRLEDAAYRDFQKDRDDWLRANPMQQPKFVQDLAHLFPPGTILC